MAIIWKGVSQWKRVGVCFNILLRPGAVGIEAVLALPVVEGVASLPRKQMVRIRVPRGARVLVETKHPLTTRWPICTWKGEEEREFITRARLPLTANKETKIVERLNRIHTWKQVMDYSRAIKVFQNSWTFLLLDLPTRSCVNEDHQAFVYYSTLSKPCIYVVPFLVK